jgi:hypothetical protein
VIGLIEKNDLVSVPFIVSSLLLFEDANPLSHESRLAFQRYLGGQAPGFLDPVVLFL